jgi:hypothetical protein
MAQPFPPQGNQQQHTERPLKVYAEQYLVGGPLPIGARNTVPTGESCPPYLTTADGIYQPLQDKDWVISSRYTGRPIEVISDEEFTERFGSGGGPNVGGVE